MKKLIAAFKKPKRSLCGMNLELNVKVETTKMTMMGLELELE